MLEDLSMDFDDYGFSKDDVFSDLPSSFEAELQVLETNFYQTRSTPQSTPAPAPPVHTTSSGSKSGSSMSLTHSFPQRSFIPLQPITPSPELVLRSTMQRVKRKAQEKYGQTCRSLLEKLQRWCPICLILSGHRLPPHQEKTFIGCRKVNTLRGSCHFQMGWQDWKKQSIEIQTETFQTCKFCGVPITIISGNHNISSNSPCQYGDILHLISWVLFHDREMFEQMAKDLQCHVSLGDSVDFHSEPHLRKEYGTWLASVPSSPEGKYTNALEVLIWVCKARNIG
jgi:hypothetical protein